LAHAASRHHDDDDDHDDYGRGAVGRARIANKKSRPRTSIEMRARQVLIPISAEPQSEAL